VAKAREQNSLPDERRKTETEEKKTEQQNRNEYKPGQPNEVTTC